ncbi:hypothetical protein [Streptomyces sp. NPDC017529]
MAISSEKGVGGTASPNSGLPDVPDAGTLHLTERAAGAPGKPHP